MGSLSVRRLGRRAYHCPLLVRRPSEPGGRDPPDAAGTGPNRFRFCRLFPLSPKPWIRGVDRAMKPFAALLFLCLAPASAATVSPLLARGYTVMPQPQVVRLGASDFAFSRDWKLELQGVPDTYSAVQVLNEELSRRFLFKFASSGQGPGIL